MSTPSLTPPLEQSPLPVAQSESGRRILWIVGIYRAVCGAALLGSALVLDLRVLGISAPNAFLTASTVYFIFGLTTFWIVQRETLPTGLPTLVSALLAGDVIGIALVMVAGGGTGGSLPILLFPQLAASGWLLRTQTAFFHAAIASFILLGPRRLAHARRSRQRRPAVPDGTHRLWLFRHDRHRRGARTVHEGVRRARDAARHRRREPRAGQPADHPGHAGRRARRRPQWRRARSQRPGDPAAGWIRPDARRHAPGGVQLDAARLLAPLAGGLHGGLAAIQGGVDAAAAARAAGPHRFGPERGHPDLPRGPRPRAERGAADEARGAGPADGIDRARGAQSAFGHQPGGAAARGGWRHPAGGRATARDDPQQREAHRPHRRRGAATQPARPAAARDRRPGRVHALAARRDRPGGECAAKRRDDPDSRTTCG